MSEEIRDLLKEANIPEKVSTGILAIFESALAEGIKVGIQTQLQEAKDEWAIKQAENLESLIESALNTWGAENKQLLESVAQSDAINEASDALRTLLGIDSVQLNESVKTYADGRISQLEQLNEETQRQLEEQLSLHESDLVELTKYRRAELFAEATEDLSEFAVDKIASFVEGKEYESDDAFKADVEAMVEAYRFKANNKAEPEGGSDGAASKLDEAGNQNAANQNGKISVADAVLQQMRG